ncbi:hypothetical protein RUM43_014555 [Polyplax serrata]|uniref:DNA repair protein SWI5 homolog n=1 Tax=Polyplax serrata TaxID=468196 RepID=A0AAN8P479_POLSC
MKMSSGSQMDLIRSSLFDQLVAEEKNMDDELKILQEKMEPSYKMELLHKYNDLKDATQILLGAIGNLEGVTVTELHNKYNLPLSS